MPTEADIIDFLKPQLGACMRLRIEGDIAIAMMHDIRGKDFAEIRIPLAPVIDMMKIRRLARAQWALAIATAGVDGGTWNPESKIHAQWEVAEAQREVLAIPAMLAYTDTLTTEKTT